MIASESLWLSFIPHIFLLGEAMELRKYVGLRSHCRVIYFQN